jgi:hypothetical protein
MTGMIMHQTLNRLKLLIKPGFIWWSLIVIGIVFRLRQYFVNRSLWSDEACLALNLVNRTLSGLTRPLDYVQGAPIGFLFIEKLFIIIFGNKDYILRIFPLISGILAIYLIYRISRKYIGTAGIFAVLLFSLNWQLIYYSSEVKQYSSDVMIALLLVYLSGNCLGGSARLKDFALLGLAGMVAIWISHPSIFFLAGIGLALILEKIIRKDYAPLAWILALGIAWIAAFGIEYLVSLRYLIANDDLQGYWMKAFMPMPPWSNPNWFVKTYYSLIYMSVSRTDLILAIIFPVLFFIGSLSLWVRYRNFAVIIISPFFMALAASALQKYPLKDRFMLFLVPLVLLIISEGLGRIYLFFAKCDRKLAVIFYAIPALVILWLSIPGVFHNFMAPYKGEDIKPVMGHIKENRTQDDIVYVFHSSIYAFNYYAPFYDLDTGNIIRGIDGPKRKLVLEQFFNDVEALRGNSRVWFIFSAVLDCGGCEGDKQQFYLDYLDSLGVRMDSFNAPGANGYLYNLSP